MSAGAGSRRRAAARSRTTAALLAVAAGLPIPGCLGEPAEIAQVRAAYERLEADAQLKARAGAELYEAGRALERAETTWDEKGDYDESVHQAYLAQRKLEVAESAARRRALEERVASLPGQRARLLRQAQESSLASQRARGARVQLTAGGRADFERWLAALDAQPAERGVVTLGDVLFDFDSAELGAATGDTLGLLAEFLRTRPRRSVLIEGHTDDSGAVEYNFDLSRRRAESVRAALVARGIEPERILAVGYGPVYPVASNATPEDRRRNRRVEVVVLARDEALSAPSRRSAAP